ncbi:MAG: sugar phosphate isomerase/epimerase [Akkermansiaceae bacterium]|nr:sugar phosphate isomerase/epimerase [Akkermansiaceae bacterium]
MKLQLVRHLWGVDQTHGLAHYLPAWREVGYEAIEIAKPFITDQAAFFRLLKETGMGWISQVFSNDFIPGGSVRQHLDSLRSQIEDCLDHEPMFCNAHSGADTWSHAQSEEFYGLALELEQQLGITIAHETHRLRPFGTPWHTHHILERFPDLRITCDFSHWVCVCERLLPDLGETIALAARHCHHVHARVGFEEGPQVPDPSAPEYAVHLAAHEAWWVEIWRAQQAAGMTVSTLTPEFGPAPYMQMLPHTKVPVAELPAVCDWMARRQQSHFDSCIEAG